MHTKLPWKVHHLYSNCLVTKENPFESLLTVDTDGAATFLKEEDCYFFVKACNTHYELVKALVAALRWIDVVPQDTQLLSMPGFNRDEVDELLEKVKS